MLFKLFNVRKLFVVLVFILIGSLMTLKAQESTYNKELLWEVQNKYCIDAIIVRDAAPNEIVFSTKDYWQGPSRVWKMIIDPSTGALISVEEKQNLSPNEHTEYTLFECSDGTLFTGGGWFGGLNPPFYSTNGGENWQQAHSGSITNSISTYDFAEFKDNIYACTGYGGYYYGRVHRWLGNGSWEEVLRIQSRTIARNLLVYGNKLFVGFLIYGGSGYQNSRPVYVSSDGNNFTPTEGIPVNYNVEYLFVVNGQLVAWVNNNNNSTERFVYLWNGTSWELLGEYTLQEGRFYCMAVTDGSAIYDYGRVPGHPSRGVYRSMDMGLTWEQLVEVEAPDACSLCVYDDMIYLGTYSDAGNKAYIYRIKPLIESTIDIISPNGGEKWMSGSTRNITWDTQGVAGNLKIYLGNAGSLTGIIAKNIDPTSGSYPWTVGQYQGGTASPGSEYAIKIKEMGAQCSDVSDAPFTICSLAVTAPNGGESLKSRSTQNITWTTHGVTNNLKIFLFKDAAVVDTIAKNIAPAPSGSYPWIVGQCLGGNVSVGTGYTIKVKEMGVHLSDFSDAPFTIFGITVTAPNGGENWQIGSTRNITWNTQGVSGNLKIFLWKDGTLVGTIAKNINPASGSYAWTVGQYVGGTAAAGTGYTIKIKEMGATVADFSDTAFTLTN